MNNDVERPAAAVGVEEVRGVGKTRVVDPDAYFAGWAFTIRPELRSALGVGPRYVIDREKTDLARERAIAGGMSKTEATRRIRIMMREIVVNTPPAYGFAEGDIFYRGAHGGADWAQVTAVGALGGKDQVEVHLPAGDFRMPVEAFASFLKTGAGPAERYLIRTADRVAEQVG